MNNLLFGLMFVASVLVTCNGEPFGFGNPVPLDETYVPTETFSQASTTSTPPTLIPTIWGSTILPTSVTSTTLDPTYAGSTTSVPTTSTPTSTLVPTPSGSTTSGSTTTSGPTTSVSTTSDSTTTSGSTTVHPTTSSSTSVGPPTTTITPTTSSSVPTTLPPPVSVLISLVVYSGLVDPQWPTVCSQSVYQSIQSLGYSSDCIPARLSYKGFLVLDSAGNEVLIIGTDPGRVELQKLLLQTMPTNAIPSILRQRVFSEIGTVSAECVSAVRRKRSAPPYNPGLWNNDRTTRRKNNCYNYANNRITNTFAQPGRGGGQIFNAKTGASVRDAAKRDGLVELNPQPGAGDPVPGAPVGAPHLVALFIDPGIDFHWYRLDQGGQWSHKPGRTRATQDDQAGNKIADPRAADTGAYQFFAFMTTDSKNVKIL